LTDERGLKSVAKNRKDKLVYDKEDEESRLPERLRNLNMTSSDVERVGKPPKKLKDYHDDQTEHSTCGGDEHGMSRQRDCMHFMHK
jgi:hypothetical protein